MDELSQDEVFALAIIEITLDVLERMGDDPDMRFDFFRRFVALATEMTEGNLIPASEQLEIERD